MLCMYIMYMYGGQRKGAEYISPILVLPIPGGCEMSRAPRVLYPSAGRDQIWYLDFTNPPFG